MVQVQGKDWNKSLQDETAQDLKRNVNLPLPDGDFTPLLTARALPLPAHSDRPWAPRDHKSSRRTVRV